MTTTNKEQRIRKKSKDSNNIRFIIQMYKLTGSWAQEKDTVVPNVG